MRDDELNIKKRFIELAARAEKTGLYTYTPFLGLAEQDVFYRMRGEISGVPYKAFGGAEGCERVMLRFGEGDRFGYGDDGDDEGEPFPIKCIAAAPANQKFSDALTHRDVLGALMGLGIERSATGDIILRNNIAYIFLAETVAEYVRENLTAAKHTNLRCSYVSELPEGELYRLMPSELTVASVRLDCIAAAFARLSRGGVTELVDKGLVFINGRQAASGAKTLANNDIVSVRGYGRFIFREALRQTKKGRLVVRIDRYE